MFTVLLFLTMAAYSAAQPALQPSSVPGIMVEEGFDAEIFATGLTSPINPTLERTGDILVLVASNCSGSCAVVRLSSAGNVIASSDPIYDPDGVAVDSWGRVFVAGNDRITIANSLNGDPDTVFATGFTNLNNIVIDSTDRIVVAEDDGRIREVTAAGTILEPPLTTLGRVGGSLAIDISDRLFAGRFNDSGGNGDLVRIHGPGDTTPIPSAVNPAAIAVGHGGLFRSEIYVANIGTGMVHRVDDATGTDTIFASGLTTPAGLVFDSTNALLVTERTFGRIIRIFPDDQAGPSAADLVADPNPTPVDGMLSLTATVSDIDTGNSNIAEADYSLDGGTVWYPMAAGDFSFNQPSEQVTATFYAFSTAGVYDLCVRATDDAANTGSEECIFMVVYDPDGGFVTGGGWIDSPEGAYAGDPSLTGKANFGFVSKYQQGANIPTGETEFQFKIADLNFHSDTYDWLVVAGPKAMFKGTGTVNGSGNYGFMISAIDEKLTPSTNVDLFRIKIWDKDAGDAIVYDNNMGAAEGDDPTTAIGGGSIVIHKAE